MKQPHRYVVTLIIDTDKHLPDLGEMIANRAWTIDGVNNVGYIHTAVLAVPSDSTSLVEAESSIVL